MWTCGDGIDQAKLFLCFNVSKRHPTATRSSRQLFMRPLSDYPCTLHLRLPVPHLKKSTSHWSKTSGYVKFTVFRQCNTMYSRGWMIKRFNGPDGIQATRCATVKGSKFWPFGNFNMPPNLKYRHFHFVPLESAPACSRLLDMGGWPLPLLFPLKLKCFYHHLHQKGGRGGWELNLRLNSTAPQPPSHHSGCQDELTVYSRQVKLLDNFLRAVKYHEFPNIPQLRNYTSLTNQILRVACSGPLFRVRFYFVTVCVCVCFIRKKKKKKAPFKISKMTQNCQAAWKCVLK